MLVNFLSVVAWIVMVFVGTFVIWKRVRDEYGDEDVVSLLGLLTIAGGVGAKALALIWSFVLGSRGGDIWSNAGLDLFGAIVAIMAVGWWFHLDRTRGLTGDVQDAIAEGIWWGGGVATLWLGGLGLARRDWTALVMTCLWWLGLGLFYWARGKYRQFSWYPSGRVGFVFWSSLVIWGVVYLIEGVMMGQLVGLIKILLGLGMVVVGLIGWYKKSGRKAHKDFGWLPGVSF